LPEIVPSKPTPQLVKEEFIDAIAQAENDLGLAESVINDIWKVTLNELGTIPDMERYRKQQAKGLEFNIPPRIAELVSSASHAPSGMVIIPKK
jgi:hypothetical protein